jgi:hypothetical protein
MKQQISLLLLITVISCGQRSDEGEQEIFDRIEYVYNLKQIIEKCWPDFSDKRFDVPLVYYTDSICYAANPTEKFLASRSAAIKVFENGEINIYKTALLDSIPFHMSASISFGDPTPDYDYRSPFMLCSSFEITRETIPDVESVAEWATMIMHEYFHGFQFRHPEFLERYEQAVISLPPQDTLKSLYKNNDWLRRSINSENDALLAALTSTDRRETIVQIDTFFRLRETRREQTRRQFGFNSAPLEQLYETMEGTARDVEWMLSGELGLSDPAADIPEWLCRTDRTTWFYASGFNLTRLLDKLCVEYRSRLFNDGALSTEQILREVSKPVPDRVI